MDGPSNRTGARVPEPNGLLPAESLRQVVQNVTDRTRNPFGMVPDCDRFVPGYGDANADFHVIGDHPGVHGGVDGGVPFTEMPWSEAFLAALDAAGLVDLRSAPTDSKESTGANAVADPAPSTDRSPYRPVNTFFSYLHMCVSDEPPDPGSYADMERFFDAELRAIAAHVLLPVGARATEHVLEQYTARAWKTTVDMDALHAEELLGSGWLVVPIKEPSAWTTADADRLVSALEELQSTDFRRESDLGRFLPGGETYLVR